MSKTARNFVLSLAAFLLSFPLLGISGWFGLGILVGLVLSILYWLDLAEECRHADSSNRLLRTACLVMGVPQALFGLLCAAIGVAIVAWVLYNTFIDRQPEYTSNLLSFGIGPVLVLFGIGWMASAFRRKSAGSDGA